MTANVSFMRSIHMECCRLSSLKAARPVPPRETEQNTEGRECQMDGALRSQTFPNTSVSKVALQSQTSPNTSVPKSVEETFRELARALSVKNQELLRMSEFLKENKLTEEKLGLAYEMIEAAKAETQAVHQELDSVLKENKRTRLLLEEKLQVVERSLACALNDLRESERWNRGLLEWLEAKNTSLASALKDLNANHRCQLHRLEASAVEIKLWRSAAEEPAHSGNEVQMVLEAENRSSGNNKQMVFEVKNRIWDNEMQTVLESINRSSGDEMQTVLEAKNRPSENERQMFLEAKNRSIVLEQAQPNSLQRVSEFELQERLRRRERELSQTKEKIPRLERELRHFRLEREREKRQLEEAKMQEQLRHEADVARLEEELRRRERIAEMWKKEAVLVEERVDRQETECDRLRRMCGDLSEGLQWVRAALAAKVEECDALRSHGASSAGADVACQTEPAAGSRSGSESESESGGPGSLYRRAAGGARGRVDVASGGTSRRSFSSGSGYGSGVTSESERDSGSEPLTWSSRIGCGPHRCFECEVGEAAGP